jgi:hypothetical protein
MMTDTPEFVRWAIERPCPLRDVDHWQDPERTERQLRALRAYSEAVAEDRVFEGICVEPAASRGLCDLAAVKGFRAAEILDTYGGGQFVESQCGDCPANGKKVHQRDALAGCYGLFELDTLSGGTFRQDVDSVIAQLGIDEEYRAAFQSTTPRWYGFWINSPLAVAQVRLLLQIFSALAEFRADYAERLRDFLSALQASLDAHLPLHVTLVPRGHADASIWTTASHCPRCKAAQAAWVHRCGACGQMGHANPPRKRRARGDRPYWPLQSFLGRDNVEPFLQRYLAYNASSVLRKTSQ